MPNYVLFIDGAESLDYQSAEQALASVGITAGGWKRLTEKDDAYFDGKCDVACPVVKDLKSRLNEDAEWDEDGEWDKDELESEFPD